MLTAASLAGREFSALPRICCVTLDRPLKFSNFNVLICKVGVSIETAATSQSCCEVSAETEGDVIHSEYMTSGGTHRLFLRLAHPCPSVLASRNHAHTSRLS